MGHALSPERKQLRGRNPGLMAMAMENVLSKGSRAGGKRIICTRGGLFPVCVCV